MQLHHQISVTSTVDTDTASEQALELATKLDLPFHPAVHECTSPLTLSYTPKGLMLLQCSSKSRKTSCLLFVDFVNGKNGYRLMHDRSIKQPLARAVGVKPGFRPTVLDATAGLGGDAFVLASLGCKLTMFERSPIMAALLEDGLKRAAIEPLTAAVIKNNLQLYHKDTISTRIDSKESFYTVYLDPMYPHRKNSALNKQSMRTIRSLVGDDADAGKLFHVALSQAANRVVVKRPEKAPALSELQPSHVISMKNSRFDVYLTFNEGR